MRETIRMRLTSASIEAAIEALEQQKRWIEVKTRELNERLALVAAAEASHRFGAAIYDGDNDVRLTAEPTDNGWQIIAKGKAVFFIEFGAGVHYNGAEPYPDPRPDGIVGIGQFGKGRGKNDSWRFKAANGEIVKTYGNPAAMPMLFAREAVLNSLREIALEVFA